MASDGVTVVMEPSDSVGVAEADAPVQSAAVDAGPPAAADPATMDTTAAEPPSPASVDLAALHSSWPRLCLVRVLHDAPALEAGDLELERGAVCAVTRIVIEGVLMYGYVVGCPEIAGFIPASAVEAIQGSVLGATPLVLEHGGTDELSRAAATSHAQGQGSVQTQVPHQTLSAGDPSSSSARASARPRPMSISLAHRRLSLRHMPALAPDELITAVAVPSATRDAMLDGVVHSVYVIEIATTRRVARVEKRFSDLRSADARLRAAFPHAFARRDMFGNIEEPSEQDSGGPALITENVHASPLMSHKRTSATMEARRLAVLRYLTQAVAWPDVADAIVSFLLSNRSSGPRGVTNEDSSAGSSAAPGEGLTVATSSPPAPPPPEISTTVSTPSDVPAAAALPPATDVSNATIEYAASDDFVPGATRAFSLDSMEAFDSLLESGYAIVLPNGETLPLSDSPPAGAAQPGQLVQVTYTCMVWDGSTTSAQLYERVTAAQFVLGDLRDDRIPRGLHKALERLHPSEDVVTVVVGPDLAYGNEGRPPHVPTCAHLVYELTLQSVSGSPQDMSAFASPQSNVPSRLGVVISPPKGIGLVDDAMLEMAGSLLANSSGAGMRVRDASRAGRASAAGADSVSASVPAPQLESPPVSPSPIWGQQPGHTAVVKGVGLTGVRQANGAIQMPSPEDAERAFRAYLQSIGQPMPEHTEAAPPRPPRAGGSSFSAGIRGLFSRPSATAAPLASTSPPLVPSASLPPTESTGRDSGVSGSLFARIFKRSSTLPASTPAAPIGGAHSVSGSDVSYVNPARSLHSDSAHSTEQ